MILTIFLARFFGFYCTIIAIVLLLRRRETIATINAMLDSPGEIMLAGVIALMAGLVLLVSHNPLQTGWLAMLLMLLGWVATAKGVALLALPGSTMRKFCLVLQVQRLFPLYMAVTLVLGLVLLAGSYFWI